MNERSEAEHIVTELHGARVAGDLDRLCRVFAADGRFKIAGASADKPIAIAEQGLAAFRPWLMMMVKVFRLSDYRQLAMVVEWPKVVVHWRSNIYSKVTGASIPTELVDILEIADGRIVSYDEFFVPCAPFRGRA
jgi:ketosteroid isomerase-like protein